MTASERKYRLQAARIMMKEVRWERAVFLTMSVLSFLVLVGAVVVLLRDGHVTLANLASIGGPTGVIARQTSKVMEIYYTTLRYLMPDA